VIEGEKADTRNSVFDSLDKYEKPKEIIFVPQFIETANGKISGKESFIQ
jgi:O-succinylbenzoic acid--CoA ligase